MDGPGEVMNRGGTGRQWMGQVRVEERSLNATPTVTILSKNPQLISLRLEDCHRK